MDGFKSVCCLYDYSKMTKKWHGTTLDVCLREVSIKRELTIKYSRYATMVLTHELEPGDL